MNNSHSSEVDWAAIVDLLAHEYGWTIKYIETLTLEQVVLLKAKIEKRYEQQNGQVSSDQKTVFEEDELNVPYFEQLGKKNTRKDGTVEIII